MQIYINGQCVDTHLKCISQLYQKIHFDNPVCIVNGYQVREDYTIQDGDSITLIEKGKMPSEEELEHMLVARHTPHVHERVKQARVAVAGLGGLGSQIVMMLARTGVGELFLVDFDIVEPSNLNRQHYSIKHLGLPKTVALESQIREVNPFIKVITLDVKVTEENAVEVFKQYPIVCEAFDNPQSKALLVQKLLGETQDCKIVAGSGMAGYESGNTITTKKKLSRLYVCGDEETEAQIGRGLMAPRVQICAGHQANMILRLILGEEGV